MNTKLLLASGLCFLAIATRADPQIDLCTGISKHDEELIVSAFERGASLGEPCGQVSPWEVWKKTHDQRIFTLLLQLGAQGIHPPTMPEKTTQPKSDEETMQEIIDEFHVVPGVKKIPRLPPYLKAKEQDEYYNRSGLGGLTTVPGKPILDVREKLIEARNLVSRSALDRSVAAVKALLGRFAVSTKIDWVTLNNFQNNGVLANIDSVLNALKAKDSILREMLLSLSDLHTQAVAYANEDSSGLADSQEHEVAESKFSLHVLDLKRQTTEGLDALHELIKHILARRIERIMGVAHMPEPFNGALYVLISADHANTERLENVVKIVEHASSADPVRIVDQFQDAMAEILMQIPWMGNRNGALLLELFKRINWIISIMNTQFNTDAIPLLLKASSSRDDKLGRAVTAEQRVALLLGPESSLRSSPGFREKIEEDKAFLGSDVVKEMASQYKNAIAFVESKGYPATRWSCPWDGLGIFLHSGWFNVEVPTSQKHAKLRAIRTLGMTRGLKVAFRKVSFDFGFLGDISFDQAFALVYFVQHVEDILGSAKLDLEGDFEKDLGRLFDVSQKERIISTAKRFAEEAEEAIKSMNDELRRKFH